MIHFLRVIYNKYIKNNPLDTFVQSYTVERGGAVKLSILLRVFEGRTVVRKLLLQVVPVVKLGTLVGEGPVWEESQQTLLFVDIIGQKIHRWSPVTNHIESMDAGDTVGFAVPRRTGGYVAGVGRSIVAVDWTTQTTTSLVEVDEDKPNNRLNDGKVDPIGRLLAGTMGKELRPAEVMKKQGSLFSVIADLTVTKHLNQVDISNGMDWSLDMKTFFYIDSLSLTIDAFDYDTNTGQLGNRRVVYSMEEGEGLPDGMTVDANGGLWVACYNGGRVINIDPFTDSLSTCDEDYFLLFRWSRLFGPLCDISQSGPRPLRHQTAAAGWTHLQGEWNRGQGSSIKFILGLIDNLNQSKHRSAVHCKNH
ncbi:regucalcin isoform X2 [Channa argus]|uniref:regucalcin isoform X2 n=1 Tax=Channa argus TaxID=215402 RepID=UPI0035219278